MSQSVEAFISWVPAGEGGRSRPPSGPTYSTVCRFEEDPRWPDQAWSLFVEFLKPIRDGRYLHANVRFLTDDAPQHLLHAGSRFELYEGRRRVAKGVVLPRALTVPDEISEFESALIG